MTTEQATQRLATLWMIGNGSPASETLAECREHSRRWDWKAANEAMSRAYALLGASAPDVPVSAIHSGKHPVQVAAEHVFDR